MRSKDPELMDRIHDYINHYIRDNHCAPTQNEVAAAMHISSSSSYRYLKTMGESGMIEYDHKVIGTDQSEKCSPDHGAPIIGSIQCGNPEEETEMVESYVRLPESIFGKGELYILHAEGTYMVDAGIQTGDLVVIRKQETAEMGNIVVALDDENKPTLKKYGGIDPVSGKAVLLYQNEKEYPNKRILVDKLIVLGVATNVIHTYDTCERGDDKNANK